MSKKIILVFALALFFATSLQAVNVYARSGTQNRVTQTYAAPPGVVMFTDRGLISEQTMFIAFDNDDRNLISRVGNARVREWNSEVDFIFRAPHLELFVQNNVAAGTEFTILLHNMTWFFRSVETHTPSIYINDNYSGGIEILLPTNYNRLAGLFVPSGVGTGGTYTRIVPLHSDEVPFELRVSDTDARYAVVTVLESAFYGDVIRIPLIAKAPSHIRGASVEVIGTNESLITSGLYQLMSARTTMPQDMRRNATHTSATVHMTGVNYIRIPQIVIRENTHGIIENGEIVLTAPEGFMIVPDVEVERLGRVTRRTPYFRDENGDYIVDIVLGGGISWRNLQVREHNYQDEAAVGTDFRFHYRNPAGDLDPSVLRIQLNNIVRSRFREPGYVAIRGLRIVAVGEVLPGEKYMEIAPFNNMEYLTTQSFHVGTIVR